MKHFNSNYFTEEKSILSPITPKNDIVFKAIFGKEGNEDILKSFLEAILGIKINYVDLSLSKELLPEFKDEKESILDIRARLDDGTQVNVEIQQNIAGFNEERCLRYWSKLYAVAAKKGAEYYEMPKTIGIWIVDGTVYKDFEHYHSIWEITERKTGIRNHFKKFEMHVIELKKFREYDKIVTNEMKNLWLGFVDQRREELVRMAYTQAEIDKAREELERITANEEIMDRIFREDMAEWDRANMIHRARREGKEEGKAEGKKEGLIEAKKEIVKKLLEKDTDIETIVELTELTKEEILELKNKN